MAYDPRLIRDDAAVKRDGANTLTSDWDIGDERKIILDELQVRDASGLTVSDTTGNVVAHITDLGGLFSLSRGVGIDEFSTDTTLSGNSDNVVPTEKATKTYIDTAISSFTTDHNLLTDLQGGDSTSEYYHLTQAIHDGLFSESPTIGIGSSSGTNFQVDYGAHFITADLEGQEILDIRKEIQKIGSENYIVLDQTSNNIAVANDQLLAFEISEDGIRLENGVTINNISNDSTTNTTTSILTSAAIRSYVDASLGELTSHQTFIDSELETITSQDSTTAWNLETDQITTLTLDDDGMLLNPINKSATGHGIYTLIVINNGSYELSFGTEYIWASGVSPVITSNGTDIFMFVCDGSNMYSIDRAGRWG